MPVTYDFDDNILALRMVGEYQPSDIRTALVAAIESPDHLGITGLLVDVRQSESIARRTLGDLTAIVGFLVYHARAYGGRVALLASTDIGYGMVRLADVDLVTGGVATRTFRELRDAMQWLKG